MIPTHYNLILSLPEETKKKYVLESVRALLTSSAPATKQMKLEVLDLLRGYFDGILVHADPGFVRLEEGIPWVQDIPVAIEYTGYVSEKPAGKIDHGKESSDRKAGVDGLVIASAGGSGNPGLLTHYINAWKRAERQQSMANYRLVIFAPLFLPDNKLDLLKGHAAGSAIEIRPFTSNFVDWMNATNLTINEAGYNTCTNILETRTPAIIIPNPLMSDQSLRARRFAASRLATVIEYRDVNPDRLGKAILETLVWPASKHNIDLDGAQKTLEFLSKP